MRVLVPLDFSKEAEKAVEFAKRQGWSVTVLHVLEESMLEKIYPWFSKPGMDFKKFVEERLREAEKELEKYDAEKRIIKTGKCWKKIIETAEEEGVDMIVMTEKGSGAVAEIEEVALGSCAERVARHAKKPVLIVR